MVRGLVTALAAVAALVMSAGPALAAGGAPDSTFSGNGKVFTSLYGDAGGSAIAVQADAKIVVAGWVHHPNEDFSRGVITRFNANGTLDRSFGRDGKVTTGEFTGGSEFSAVAVQADAKIVAAGSAGGRNSMFLLARYTPSGRLDASFGHGRNGYVLTSFGPGGGSAKAVALQPDGRIVAAGSNDRRRAAMARYNPDGTLDKSFSGDGKTTTNQMLINAIALQSDGKILAAGTVNPSTSAAFSVLRYNPTGTIDTSFGRDGIATAKFPRGGQAFGIAIGANGKIVTTGYTEPWATLPAFALARFSSNGKPDASFGPNGTVTTRFPAVGDQDFAYSVAIQSNGKIVAAGGTYPTEAAGSSRAIRFALARYNVNGSLDPSFGSHGVVQTTFMKWGGWAQSVAIQADGRIVAAGSWGFEQGLALARYLG
jgi:uncharacterized delta-60 repeat protein